MEQRLTPPLENDRPDIMKIGNKLLEVVEAHIGRYPFRKALPDAHAAGERAARRDLDLPGKELFATAEGKQFLKKSMAHMLDPSRPLPD